MKSLRLLLLAFILCGFPCVSFAQDTSWYSEGETVFTLTTAEQFIGFRDLVNGGNSFKGKIIKLGDDIDISAINWTEPIAAEEGFSGVFDGCRHTVIYNSSIDKGIYRNYGLFAILGGYGKITRLTVEGSLTVNSFQGNSYPDCIGGIVGQAGGEISHCKNQVTIKTVSVGAAEGYVGGICGIGGSKIFLCVNDANISCTPSSGEWRNWVGGICGFMRGGEISRCENRGEIRCVTHPSYVGGIVGNVRKNSLGVHNIVTFCSNTGSCYAIADYSGVKYSYADAGGIVNRYGSANVKDCFVAIKNLWATGYNATSNAFYFYDPNGEGFSSIENCYANSNISYKPSHGNPTNVEGLSFSYTLAQMKTVDFANKLNESRSDSEMAWVGGDGVFPVVIGSMSETDQYVYSEPEEIAFGCDAIDMPVMGREEIPVSVLPLGAYHKLTWESSNESIVTVDEDGVLWSVGLGDAVVTATSTRNNSITASINVHVGSKELREITLPEGMSVEINKSVFIKPNLTPTYAECQLTWQSSDESIATVGSTGYVKGVSLGETTITVTDELTGKSAQSKVTVIPSWPFSAQTPEGVELVYDLKDAQQKTCYVKQVSNKNDEHSITIPDEIYGYNVIEIGESAFNEASISGVSIPGSVKIIGNSAFYNSKVKEVNMQEGVENIGEDAFKYAYSLEKITIPSSAKAIGSGAFTGCQAITGVYINDISSWCRINFEDLSANPLGNNYWTKLYINETPLVSLTIPSDISVIKDKVFQGYKSLTSVIIPSHVTSIETNAFNGCNNLTSVRVNWTEPLSISSACFSNAAYAVLYVPKGCREAYAYADNWNKFSSIVEPSHVNGDIFEAPIIVGNSTTNAKFKVMDSENRYVCMGSGEEGSIPDWTSGDVTVPASVKGYDGLTYRVTRIENFAFFSCYEMTSINIPQGVTSIGGGAFYYCSALESVSLPQNLTSIGENAFVYCMNLPEITIPQNVTSIGTGAFAYCDNLITVTAERTEPVTIDNDCFSNAANATLYVPVGSKATYKAATGWKNFGQILDGTENLLMADDVEVCRGGQLTLPIILSNEETIRALQFELSLPQGVSVVTDGKGNPLASLTQRASSTHIITGALMPNGNYQFQIMPKTISDDIILENDGRIATITLKVLLNVTPNDYTIKITDSELSVDGNIMPLLLSDTYSKLTVSSVLLGDTNNDKRVSVTDISNIIDYILHKDIQGFVWHAADASGDEKISVTDISTIIDIILHKTVFGERQATRIEELNQQ